MWIAAEKASLMAWPSFFWRACLGAAQRGFDFAPHRLNRLEVRRGKSRRLLCQRREQGGTRFSRSDLPAGRFHPSRQIEERPSGNALDRCASKAANLLRKLSPRLSLAPLGMKGINASERPTLRCSAGPSARSTG